MIDLSIIIVSFNAGDDLERCLTSLAENPPALPHEIIVVDNGSSDDCVNRAKNAGAQVVEAGSNLGFARATNIGIRKSRGANLLLLNSDTVVPPRSIDGLREELDRHPDVAIVGPRLVDGRGRPELSFGPAIGPINEWRQKRRARGDIEGLTRRRQYPDWVSGACLLVRRPDAEAVGLLDERFFMYTEDVDFCKSIRSRGRRVLFTPDVEIVHLRGRSVAAAPEETERARRRSQIAFYEKHHPSWAPILRVYLKLRGRL